MSPTIRSPVIPVSDLDAAKAMYSALLGSPRTDESYHVGYNSNGFEVGLNAAGEGGGPVAFADVADLDAARETLLAAGATERDAPRQVAPGARICVLADPDGNPIGLRGKSPTCGSAAAVPQQPRYGGSFADPAGTSGTIRQSARGKNEPYAE
jgi:catechol 2,3-dioxygenase-like lactoylglutathione lyase family enzyme